MNFNNGLYVFNEVPGYDASKGERIVPSCNINMNMNNLGSTDIASEVVVSDTREVEIADILVGMPVETVNANCEVNEEQPLIALQPLLDASSQEIILQPQEEIVGADSESEGLSAYETIPVSTSEVILDSNTGQPKRGRKGKKIANKGKLTGEQMSEKRAARKWDRKQVQIKTLEGIVKALHKFWIKIANLEQMRIIEKKTLSKEVQTSNDADLTLADVQVELLRTQLFYLIKIAREYANEEPQVSSKCQNLSMEVQKSCQITPSGNSCVENIPESIRHVKSHEDASSSTTDLQNNVFTEIYGEIKMIHDKFETESSSMKPCASTSTPAISHVHPKGNSQPHYHLKLDDIPFILGASSSASHSVVANVQNIIARMKMHNRALCATKPQIRQNIAPISSMKNKSCQQDANEMLQELSKDLSKLTMKQEKLKQMFDNSQAAHVSIKTKSEVNHSNDKQENIKNTDSIRCVDKQNAGPSKVCKELLKNNVKDTLKNEEKPLVPTDKMKANHPYLARRKMLRTLQGFKMHLSEEDISWN